MMAIIKRLNIIVSSSWKTAKVLNTFVGDLRMVLFADMLISKLLFGANDEDYCAMEFYRKSFRERNRFVTSRRNFVFFFHRFYDKEAIGVFDRKDKFNHRFSRFIQREWIYSGEVSAEQIRNFIKKHEQVIVKPTGGCEGIGVYKLNAKNEKDVDQLMDQIRIGQHCMIEQVILSHPAIAALNPPSVNTLRIETCIDKTGKIHITNSIIIMGTGESCVNNTHSGGIMCHVNWATGVIDSLGRNPRGEKYFRHPATGIILPGYQIPSWDKLESYVRELASIVRSARFIGWDIVVTPEGFEIIEGNVRPGHCTQACDGVGRWKLLKSML